MAASVRATYSTAASLTQSGVSVVAGDLILCYCGLQNSSIINTFTDNAAGGSNVYTRLAGSTDYAWQRNVTLAGVSSEVAWAIAKVVMAKYKMERKP